MKTRAAVLERIGEPLALLELDVPELKPGQVLVDIHCSGICRTQVNEWLGRKGPDRYLPHTLGHEGAGEVLRTGAEVTRVKAGDKVVVTWIKGVGHDVGSCQYSHGGRVINSGAVSTFMTKSVISENRLVPFSDVSMTVAALMGCAVPTGCGMVLNELRPGPGSSIAVWGVGGIGLCVVLAAAVCGCDPIIAVDINESKLSQAKECGATHLVNGAEDPVSLIMKITAGQGTDYGVESAGSIAVMEAGMAAIKRVGGKLLIAGNPPHGEKLALDPFDLIGGKRIAGTWGGACSPEKDIPRYIEMYRSGKLELEKIITRRLPFDRINEALSLVESGESGRVMIEMK